MRFGVCAAPQEADWIAETGADFIEGGVQPVLAPRQADWAPPVAPARLPLPVAAFNGFFPRELKLTGPKADLEAVTTYAGRAFERAARMGAKVVALGSGGARQVADGWPRDRAEEQLVEVLQATGPLAREAGVTIALEPLRKAESNVLNTVEEALELVEAADAPGVAVLADFFHLSVEGEPLEHLAAAGERLVHVHVSDPEDRGPPGPGGADYGPLMATLKAIGYAGRISLECRWEDMRRELGPALEFLRDQWSETR